jgi:hypothetical protein
MPDFRLVNLPYSVTYSQFKRTLTFINDLYWTSIPQKILSHRFAKDYGADESTSSALGISGENTHRYPSTIQKFEQCSKELERWIRLNTIIGIASNLEKFFTSVLRIRFLHNPALILGNPSLISGFSSLYKTNATLNDKITKLVDKIMVGTWDQRANQIKSYFTELDSFFTGDIISQLDEIRIRRNDVAHRLGVSVDINKYVQVDLTFQFIGFSQKNLQKYLNISQKIASHVDSLLMGEELKRFEFLIFLKENFEPEMLRRALVDGSIFRLLKKDINAFFYGTIIGKSDLLLALECLADLKKQA